MRSGIMSLALAGALAWTSVIVHAGQVAKVCERKHRLPGGIVTVKESHQYVIGTSSTCPEPEMLSPLPPARILVPPPQMGSSLVRAAQSLPRVLPAEGPIGSSPASRDVTPSSEECVLTADIRHETVHFESGSSTVRPEDERKLRELVSGTVQYLRVEGYTDPHGSRAENERLARERAAAVAALTARAASGAPVIERTGSALCCYQEDDAASRRVEVTAVAARPCGIREHGPAMGVKAIGRATRTEKGGVTP